MKKNLILFVFMVVFVSCFSLCAFSESYKELTYEINNGEITITHCTSSAVSVSIPEEIDGCPVVYIGEFAFSGCTGLCEVNIPDSLRSIDDYAFYNCPSLYSVTIPDGVSYIGRYSFAYCRNLALATIPESVVYIDGYAFYNCAELKIFGEKRSFAEAFADDNGIPFEKTKDCNVSFSADGEIFRTYTVFCNTKIEFPIAPEKDSDNFFDYEFSHWSLSPNGSPVDASKSYACGTSTYYAVYEREKNGIWDGNGTKPFIIGDGSEESPYEISDAYMLAYLAQSVNSGTALKQASYILTSDIDLGGFEWTPVGTVENPFAGVFDGNGHTVKNFRITDANCSYAGLFGYVENSEISKLEVSCFEIKIADNDRKNKYFAGGIAAYVVSSGKGNNSRISECSANGQINIVSKFAYAGGIAGHISDTDTSFVYIENCHANAEISVNTVSNSTAGGIAGEFKSQNIGISYIDKCYADGIITSKSDVASYAGGIVGFLFNDEEWAEVSGEEAVLSAEKAAAIKNCFYAGEKITLSLGHTSYGGAIYGYRNPAAKVEHCAYDSGFKITASTTASDKNVLAVSHDSFCDSGFVKDAFGFDVDNVWSFGGALPVLKASYQTDKYYIIYDANGGIGAPDVQMKNHGESIYLDTKKPTREGYTFKGWTAAGDTDYVWYFEGEEYTADSDIVLYALWQVDVYSVKYSVYPGEGEPSEQKKVYGEELLLDRSIPSREGYIFAGWSTTKTGNPEYYPGDIFSENKKVTLFAVWVENFEGKCGDNLSYVLDADGNLTVSGEGEMYDGCFDDEYRYIKKVELENGVTSVGAGAFKGCKILDWVFVPDSVEKIGYGAFDNCNEEFWICGVPGGFAEEYAEDNGWHFMPFDIKAVMLKGNCEINLELVPKKCKLVVTGYANGRLVYCKMQTVKESDGIFPIPDGVDTVKIFVFEDTLSAKPMTQCEELYL